jgi:hypothetical protein
VHVRTTGRCGGRPSGHLPVVRYLVEEAGANVHALDDYALLRRDRGEGEVSTLNPSFAAPREHRGPNLGEKLAG